MCAIDNAPGCKRSVEKRWDVWVCDRSAAGGSPLQRARCSRERLIASAGARRAEPIACVDRGDATQRPSPRGYTATDSSRVAFNSRSSSSGLSGFWNQRATPDAPQSSPTWSGV